MGRSPCCSNKGKKRGAWTATEDQILADYIKVHGQGKWRKITKETGLKRCGKSCRLRWLNYLRPDIKRGNITQDEEDLIIRLHKLLGNRWSLIAGRLPGRTDNEIKNYWNSYLSKKAYGNQPNSSKLEKKPIPTGVPGRCSGKAITVTPQKPSLDTRIEPNDNIAAESESSDGSPGLMRSKDDSFSELMAGFYSREMGSPEFLAPNDFLNFSDEFGIYDLDNVTKDDQQPHMHGEAFVNAGKEVVEKNCVEGSMEDSDFGSLAAAFLGVEDDWMI
ncbi:hypothetical protein SLEP1_g15942 [Rubroshorea leprosula]|uniref:Uncharacterized protein n=1 Tax=Rubroshorea leprosula TaxID=152421 RepID=A0AAV5IP38_9ROSI|nr:hypothetical protein SLEP1_g15942 [Rubroshorea leprosula]